jgi:hypothetical protein
MYAVPFSAPTVPASRPIIESSANTYSRDIRSRASIAAVVGCALCFSGSGGVADAPLCACKKEGTIASAAISVVGRTGIGCDLQR